METSAIYERLVNILVTENWGTPNLSNNPEGYILSTLASMPNEKIEGFFKYLQDSFTEAPLPDISCMRMKTRARYIMAGGALPNVRKGFALRLANMVRRFEATRDSH